MEEKKELGESLNNQNNCSSIRGPCNVIAIILCVILIPILVINCCLIINSLSNPDGIPSLGKYSPLIVLTESMEPKIKSGDLIVCKKVSSDYIEEEMIISFFEPTGDGQTVVTHRINRIELDEETNTIYYYTQGINNNIEDRNPVPFENVIGVYTGFRLPLIGKIILFIQNPIGLLICIAIPILIFVIIWHFKRSIDKKKNPMETDIDEAKSRIIELENELEALKESMKNNKK